MPRAAAAVFVVLAALAAITAPADGALHPVAQDVQNVSSPEAVVEHRSVVKEWHVQSDGPIDDTVIRKLQLSIPGRTFVRVYTSEEEKEFVDKQVAAVVRVFSDIADVVNLFDVVTEDNGEVLRVRQPGGSSINGYLLIEVALASTNQVHTVINDGSSDVVVQDGALRVAGVGTLTITNQGSGDVYVDASAQLQLDELQLRVDGSGDVQLNAPGGIVATKWSTGNDGSGDLKVFAGAANISSVTIDVDSSGDICFQSESFDANKVSVLVDGSGDWTMASPGGRCVQSTLSVDGSGDIRAGALVCDNVEVSVDGSGDVVFQATQQFDGSKDGSGDIRYVGDAPPRMNTHNPRIAKPVHRAPKDYQCKRSNVVSFRPVRMGFVFGPWGGAGALRPNDLTVLTVVAFFAALYLWREREARRRRRARYEAQPLLGREQSSVFV